MNCIKSVCGNARLIFGVLTAALFSALVLAGCGDKEGGDPVTPSAEYTLKIFLNPVSGGSVDCEPSKTTYKAGDTVTVTATADDGYRFVRWTGVSTSTDAVIAIIVNANLELTANFEQTATPPENARTITFNANGGTVSPASRTTDADGKLASLPTPTRSGYTFDGWYTAATGGTEVTTSMTFSANATIYARWTAEPPPKSYKITFDANGGTVNPTSGTTGADDKLASLPTPTRDGYDFDGWFTTATGGTAVTTSTVFSANATIYAQWTDNSSFIDSRDGKEYKKVKINSQTWMAENLDYDVPNAETDVCYDNNAENCARYGRLYNWNTAVNGADGSSTNPSGIRGVCPVGWHLPSRAEWKTLFNYVGTNPGTKLKSSTGWNSSTAPAGLDIYGFSALPGGYSNGSSQNAGREGFWWSTTESGSQSYTQSMYYNNEAVAEYANYKTNLYSVRCVED